jgi:hypothetical protein
LPQPSTAADKVGAVKLPELADEPPDLLAGLLLLVGLPSAIPEPGTAEAVAELFDVAGPLVEPPAGLLGAVGEPPLLTVGLPAAAGVLPPTAWVEDPDEHPISAHRPRMATEPAIVDFRRSIELHPFVS